MIDQAHRFTNPKWRRLNEAIVDLIDNYSMVQFSTLNIRDEDSISRLMGEIDCAMNYSDYEEVKDRLKDLGDGLDDE